MTKSPNLDVAAVIAAPPGRVMKAFFDHETLHAWWQVSHSVTTPRALGVYALEWPPTYFQDDILGRLGGVFRGTVVKCQVGEGFFVADAFWLPPDGDPIGPMALHVTFRPEGEAKTLIRVMQTGYEESARWRRYYEVIDLGWQRALASLKSLLEK